jgi:uncharacterized tellurite resistance protein B-like protein
MAGEILGSRLEGTTLVVETQDGEQTYDSRFLVAALLIFIAQGSGRIEPEESGKIIELIEGHFQMQGPESLELITYALSEMIEKPSLPRLLAELGKTLSPSEKEDIALMGLKVAAADGRRDLAEMEQFKRAMAGLGIAPDTVHRAFDRFFSETMPGD